MTNPTDPLNQRSNISADGTIAFSTMTFTQSVADLSEDTFDDLVAILVSRVLEDYAVTDDPDQTIITGLTNTGKVILSAAVIMGSVFFVFVTNPSPVVKMIGFGWALAYSPTH